MASCNSVSGEKEEAHKAEYVRIPYSMQDINKCGPIVCSLSDMYVVDESLCPPATLEVMTQMAKQVLARVESACWV